MRETPQDCSSERKATDLSVVCSGYSRYARKVLTLPYWWARRRSLLTIIYDGSVAGRAQFSGTGWSACCKVHIGADSGDHAALTIIPKNGDTGRRIHVFLFL